MRVRLASYNIHKCLGLDRRRRPDRVLAVMAGLDADVIALQEVDHRLGHRPAALSRDLAEHATGLRAVPAALGRHSFGWHGQVILARPGLELTGLVRIDLPGLEPRGALAAEFRGDGPAFRVIAVHLGLFRRSRKLQLAALAAALSHRPALPTAIIGDFNEWSPARGTETLGAGFTVHAPGPSFPAARPVARLDRIALGPDLHLMAAGTHHNGPARIASDHLPIWADVRVGPAQAG
ncbi:MAG: endonuclease/exonuclease/phosphatase family protein [Proteobacteria bacterium]|nr:endonuclease/exonuclease/phosphatase family protein [Pseudomonadota bacterium]MBS0572285.1 endonuclease/exonuclease/phosphatase family protein [Pseudomonadota bacterium]